MLVLCRPSASLPAHNRPSVLPTKIQPISRMSNAGSGNTSVAQETPQKAVTMCVDVDDANEDFLPEL